MAVGRSAVEFNVIALFYYLIAIYLSMHTGVDVENSAWKFGYVFTVFGILFSIYLSYLYVKFVFRDRNSWQGFEFGRRSVELGQAIVQLTCLVLFHCAFTAMKNNLRFFNNYNWDERLADLDKAIHFGLDAWVLYVDIFGDVSFSVMEFFYLPVWLLFFIVTVVHCIFFEKNKLFKRKYLITYAFTWIFMGNVLAAGFLSGGPVYYSNFTDGSIRFEDLFSYQRNLGFAETRFFEVQKFLWQEYESENFQIGTGISAFPSMHVSIATLSALYLCRKGLFFALIGVSYVVFIQIASVLSGYHYAIDGYVPIIFILFVWHLYTVKDVDAEMQLNCQRSL